jgi:hypothetical protein
MGGARSTYGRGERRGAYRVVVRKPEGHGPLGRPRRRKEEILELIIRQSDRKMDWIDLALDTDRLRTLVNEVMNLRVPSSAGNFLTI